MPRLGLALSGGGFRATLYHLGVIRFLKDSGQLQHVTDIASVSGGSILAAHVVLNWDRYNGDDQRFDEAASEIVKFVQFDVRNRIIRRLPLQYLLRSLVKLTPVDGSRLTPNTILERYYRKLLYGDRRLYELPKQPALHILSTNISNGGLSVFNREGLFLQQRSGSRGTGFDHIPGQMASIPRVVGASSAFPGLFPPVKITAADLGVREGQFTTEWFTDGGVYDNLGIRAFSWLKQRNVEFEQIIVSDAGKPFQILSDASLGVLGQSMRATDILWDRVWQLERQNFGERPGFVFLPITETVSESEDPTAQHPVVQAEVQSVRTDLDRFSDVEINALARHGYEVARKICVQNEIIDANQLSSPPWAPIPDEDMIAASSSGERPGEPSLPTRQALELRKSSQRRTWSTLFSPRDWPSYMYVTLIVLLFFVLPFQVYELYHHSQMQADMIDSITEGDNDLRLILDLVNMDPTSDWTAETIREIPEASEIDYTGIEILEHSRIIDLRRWRPHLKLKSLQGDVYVRDRLTLILLDSYKGDRRVTFSLLLQNDKAEFRQPDSQIPGVISRVAKPIEEFGRKKTCYEVEYDLTGIPLGEPVTLEIECVVKIDKPRSRAPFITRIKSDLISMWMLFPTDRPYRNYSLVRYPVDRSSPPEVMSSRYTIDHPYGSLIGWSVVNPKQDTVYECRWTTD